MFDDCSAKNKTKGNRTETTKTTAINKCSMNASNMRTGEASLAFHTFSLLLRLSVHRYCTSAPVCCLYTLSHTSKRRTGVSRCVTGRKEQSARPGCDTALLSHGTHTGPSHRGRQRISQKHRTQQPQRLLTTLSRGNVLYLICVGAFRVYRTLQGQDRDVTPRVT